MKMRFGFLYNLGMCCLAAVLFWALYAQAAEPATNALPGMAEQTNAPVQVGAKTGLSFGLDRIAWLQQRPFAGIPAWQYLASFIYIFLAFYVSKLLDYIIRERVHKWTAKTKTRFDDLLVGLVRGPVKIVTFVILLHVGMQVYAWPAALANFFSAALKIVVAVSITYVLLKTVDALIGVWRERSTTPENEQFSKQLLPLIAKSLKVFVVIVALLVTSQNLGLNVTGLIASLSIGGLALGLAAQDTLANLFGAVAVLIDKPCQVGDRVQLEGVDGIVESIGFRSTRIRNLDGHLVTVPNKTMGNATITNISRRPNIKTVTNIGITYDTPPEKVQRALAILEEVYRAHPKTSDLILSFDKFSDSSLNLLVVHWWGGTDYKAYLAGIKEFNLAIKKRFDDEGIEFAFPTRTLYVKHDGELPAPTEAALKNRGALP